MKVLERHEPIAVTDLASSRRRVLVSGENAVEAEIEALDRQPPLWQHDRLQHRIKGVEWVANRMQDLHSGEIGDCSIENRQRVLVFLAKRVREEAITVGSQRKMMMLQQAVDIRELDTVDRGVGKVKRHEKLPSRDRSVAEQARQFGFHGVAPMVDGFVPRPAEACGVPVGAERRAPYQLVD